LTSGEHRQQQDWSSRNAPEKHFSYCGRVRASE
jgi:hypothetical protein